MIKKLCAMLLCLVVALVGFACAPKGLSGNPKPPPKEKATLLFEIDEGIGENEVTTVYGSNITEMERALGNICEALEPLRETYEVAVLIYPTWHYFRGGYMGKDPSLPQNRISANLLRTFSFFESKEMPVYLEMYSSGIRTSQNGEAGSHPAPYLHYGEGEPRKGISMDLEVIAYLKEAFPETFAGLRFHELIGTNDIGLNDRKNGTEEISHGFVVEEEVLYEIFDTVQEYDLKLVWGDHSWNTAFKPDYSSKSGYEYWKTWLDTAIDTIDSENLTLNWSNNGWPMQQYILNDFSLRDYRNTKRGMSVQSWFWQELDASTTRVRYDGAATDTVKWYKYQENDMPVELMAAYTLKCLREGGTLVQYEHPQYFFNYSFVNATGADDYSGYYEDAPDYSGRLRLKRLIDILLDPDNADNPNHNVKAYFDSNADLLTDYKEGSGAKRYYQTMLGGLGDGEAVFYDRLNDDLTKWTENSNNRYTQSALSGDIRFATRFNANYSAIEELLLVKQKNGRLVGEFYNAYSGKITEDAVTFADSAEGTVVGVTALNAVSAYENAVEGDPDELVLVREKQGAYTYELYQARSQGSTGSQHFTLTKVDSAPLTALLGSAAMAQTNVKGIVPLKTRNALLKNCTKPIDAGLAVVSEQNGTIAVHGQIDGQTFRLTPQFAGEYVTAFTADIDADCKDEIAIVSRSNGRTLVQFYAQSGASEPTETLDLGSRDVTVLFSQKTATYYKAY